MKNYKERYEEWLNNPYFDQKFNEELQGLKSLSDEALEDRFYKDLAFGTGGLRGVIGAGTNRINKYIVRKATQGFASFVLNKGGDLEKSAVIAHDNRNMSEEFSLEAALVFAANGIKTYLFKSLRSTPELSYAVRNLGANCGVVVTASHNPPEYNGYKVYGDDGCQLIPQEAELVIDEINGIDSFSDVKFMTEEEAIEKGLLVYLDEKQDNDYLDMVVSMAINKEIVGKMADDLRVVYTPLHGAGGRPVVETMKRIGLKHFYPVAEQMVVDPNFSTVISPNPEEFSAFEMAIELSKEKGADLAVATDPDSDRVGLVVKDDDGKYIGLNGNQTGVLLVDYILNGMREIPANSVIVNTIVTSAMASRVAKTYNVETQSTLTGFKFIGEKIKSFEDGSKNFIFGYEESYGYLIGTEVRDKDAVSAVMLVVEMAAFYKSQGKTLLDRLEELHQEHGYFLEGLQAIGLAGKEGLEKIGRIMTHFRENPVKALNGVKVKALMDCQTQKIRNLSDGKTVATGLPASNVLKFILENGAWFAARPSGTEPKIKFYFSSFGETKEACAENLEIMKKTVLDIVEDIE